MNLYEKLPHDHLINLFNEINKNIQKEVLTKKMYYELGLIISALEQKGITVCKPLDYDQIIDHKVLKNLSA